uniref:Poly(ADP-ribose) polymerase family member 12 n=1 Tax=Leptobrachium leishanense TaxID=445787 RepID=A0A8C5Q8C6_9ANUR
MAAYESLSTRLRKVLASSGGSMELEALKRALRLDAERMGTLIEVEEGTSLKISKQDDKEVVLFSCALRACSERGKTCAGDCEKIHLCRYFILGSCNRSPCKFNHDIHTAHNLKVLKKNQLEALTVNELLQTLLQNDPSLLPDVCSHYNRGDGPYGSCTYKSSCNKLHICQHYLQGSCKFGSKCKRSHDLQEAQTLAQLTKWGLKGTFLPNLLNIYRNAGALTDNIAASPRKAQPPSKTEKPSSQKHVVTENTEEICLFFLLNSCNFKDRCVRDHFGLPYRWQVCDKDTWKDIGSMEVIEQAYCDPNSSAPISGLDYNTMTYKKCNIRRLSTPSSVSKPPHFILTTEWLWYWKDEYNIWMEYGGQCDLHSLSNITSSDLENVYLSDKAADIPFKAGKHEYVLNFKDMVQRNTQYGTERMVCRRPKFVSSEDVQKKKSRKSESSKEDCNSLPPHWDKGHIPDAGYKLIPLTKASAEYKKIEATFHRTLQTVTIQSIQRIQNVSLWQVYQWQKDQMKKQNGGKEVEEKQLFHGTNDKLVDAICQQNFDWRICGANGTAYGKGSYFARDSSYSHNYSKRTDSLTQIMFVARVLVGDYIRGNSSYLRPPAKQRSSSSFYDSCVDSESYCWPPKHWRTVKRTRGQKKCKHVAACWCHLSQGLTCF